MIDLRRAIADEPLAIGALADDLNIPTIAYVPPKFYRKSKPHRFDQAKAESNIVEISTICDGADWITVDLEKESRSILRDPDEYDNEEIKWAAETHVEMWDWFRKHFPNAKLTEYNLANGRGTSTELSLAEALVVEKLDAFDVRMYWTENLDRNRRILLRAASLATRFHMKLIIWLWDRYKISHDWGTEYAPLNQVQLDQMLLMGISAGVGIAALWSNTYAIQAAADPKKALTEWNDQPPTDDLLPEINAHTAIVLSSMRLRAEAVE